MTEENNLKIIQSIIEEYKKGHPQAPPEEYLAEDAEWILSGSIDDPMIGRYRGRKQIEQMFAKFNETIEGERHSPKEYIAQGDKVVVCGDEKIRFKYTGRSVECNFIYVYTLRDGKIVQFRAMYGYS